MESASLTPRQVVQAFARAMETRLRANDHKGGWQDCNPGWLLKRLYDEVDELAEELIKYQCSSIETEVAKIAKEAADVANFAMMIADVAGGLKEG